MKQSAHTTIENLDLPLLKKQCGTLIKLTRSKHISENEKENLQGLINFIDCLTDEIELNRSVGK